MHENDAMRVTGLCEKTAVVHAGLKALVAKDTACRLIAPGVASPRSAAFTTSPIGTVLGVAVTDRQTSRG